MEWFFLSWVLGVIVVKLEVGGEIVCRVVFWGGVSIIFWDNLF